MTSTQTDSTAGNAADHPSEPVVLTDLRRVRIERRRLDAREAELIVEAEAQGVCLFEYGLSTPMWLADDSKISGKAARARVRIAERLHSRYPALAAALADGLIGWQHVAAFDRAANPRNWREMAELLPELIDLAQVSTFDRWSQEVRGISQRLDQDGGYDPAKDPANNHLHLVPTMDGVTHISGQLVGELALMVKALIDQETDRVLKRYRNDHETSDGEIAVPSRAQAAAEALAEIAERAAGTPDGDGKLPEPEIVVVLNDDTGDLTDDSGNHLSPEILRLILAAGFIRPLETTGRGDPLRMGRTLRYANRQQRRALVVRDGGCIFPGCDRPASWCDAHHADHWDDGGPTDTENLGLLCRFHHRVTHRPGWVMARWRSASIPPNQVVFTWTTPGGRTLYSQRHHQRTRPTS